MSTVSKILHQDIRLQPSSTLFLKIVILLIGLVALVLCAVVFPMGLMIGTLAEYRFFTLSLYIPAMPFFVALFKAYKLLGYIEENQIFTITSVKALRSIKNCAVVIGGLFLMGMPYVFYVADQDDSPGFALIGLVIISASFVIATFAALMQKLIQNATDIKSENDLTV